MAQVKKSSNHHSFFFFFLKIHFSEVSPFWLRRLRAASVSEKSQEFTLGRVDVKIILSTPIQQVATTHPRYVSEPIKAGSN